MLLILLRNANPGIRHFNIEELMICIQSHPHPAILNVIFYRIFHQVIDRQGKFHLVHIRRHFPDALIDQFYIPFLGNGPQPL